MTDLERAHSQRLMEVSVRHRQELDAESERLRTAQQQAEITLENRERAHRQRIRGLEEQVNQWGRFLLRKKNHMDETPCY